MFRQVAKLFHLTTEDRVVLIDQKGEVVSHFQHIIDQYPSVVDFVINQRRPYAIIFNDNVYYITLSSLLKMI